MAGRNVFNKLNLHTDTHTDKAVDFKGGAAA